MASNLHRIFVYGTLKVGQPNYPVMQTRHGVCKLLGTARTVERRPLVIASHFNVPFLLDAEGKGEKVLGEIVEVDETMLKFLDDFEGHPYWYERENIPVEICDVIEDTDTSVLSKGQVVDCGAYLLKKYQDYMIDLPYLECYNSQGAHGKPYVTREQRLGEVDFQSLVSATRKK